VTLTSLFCGDSQKGDKNAGTRRDDAVALGLLDVLSDLVLGVLRMQFDRAGFILHSAFGTLIHLLNDPGDDPGAAGRQDIAVATSGIHNLCRSANAGYPYHEGVTGCASKVLAILGPAMRRAGLS